MGNLKKEKPKASGNFIMKMVIDISVIINTILKMAMELIIIPMGKNMLVNLKKGQNMVMDSQLRKMGHFMKSNSKIMLFQKRAKK